MIRTGRNEKKSKEAKVDEPFSILGRPFSTDPHRVLLILLPMRRYVVRQRIVLVNVKRRSESVSEAKRQQSEGRLTGFGALNKA